MINWIIELMLILMVSHGHKKKGKIQNIPWLLPPATDDVIIAERIFSSRVAYNLSSGRIEGAFPSLYDWERAQGLRIQFLCEQNWMLSLLSQILQVRVMQYKQWAPSGRNHKSAWRTKQNLVRAVMRCRSVQCVCLPRVYIWNNEPEHAKDAMLL